MHLSMSLKLQIYICCPKVNYLQEIIVSVAICMNAENKIMHYIPVMVIGILNSCSVFVVVLGRVT